MGRFAVGDTVEIRDEGIHGFHEGTQVIVTEVGFEGEGGEPTYKVDHEQGGRRRSRYIEGKDLRSPSPAVANPLSKRAREEETIVKANAVEDSLAKVKDPTPKAKAKGTPPASQKAGGKPSEPKSPKLRPLKVHTDQKADPVTRKPTVKKAVVAKPKPTKGSLVKQGEKAKSKQAKAKPAPKPDSGAKVVSKKAQLR